MQNYEGAEMASTMARIFIAPGETDKHFSTKSFGPGTALNDLEAGYVVLTELWEFQRTLVPGSTPCPFDFSFWWTRDVGRSNMSFSFTNFFRVFHRLEYKARFHVRDSLCGSCTDVKTFQDAPPSLFR